MDHVLFKGLITAFGAITGWVLKVIWDALKEIRVDMSKNNAQVQDDLKRLEIKVSENYVRREDLKELKSSIDARFDKIDNGIIYLTSRVDKRQRDG